MLKLSNAKSRPANRLFRIDFKATLHRAEARLSAGPPRSYSACPAPHRVPMNNAVDSYFSQIRIPGIGPLFTGRIRFVGYAVALLLVAVVAFGRFALAPVLGHQAPLLPFVLVVAVAGYVGGRGSAWVAIVASIVAAHLLFRHWSGAQYETAGWAGHLVLFALIGTLIAEVIHRLQRAEAALRDSVQRARDAERALQASERKLAEDALRESEERLRTILDRASAVVFVKDREGYYLFVNEEFLRIFAMKREDVMGKRDVDLFPRETAAEVRGHDLRVWESDAPYTAEETVPQTDGLHTYVSTKFPLRGLNGKPYAVCGIATDITDQKHVEAALREADRRKDIFLATLSHELRNPLAPIRHAARLLRAPGVSAADADRARDIIERQSQHMSRLLDDLLDVARITRGSLELRKEPLDLSSVIDTALEASQPLVEARQHTVTLDVPQTPLRVEADAVRLSQVIANLLTNAAKYTEPGGSIRVQASLEGNDIVLRVTDNGIGIPADVLPKIFEMFSQGKSERQHAEGGLGIGLALVRGLLELHGGTIEARSDGAGRGSEFIARLPAGTAVRMEEPIASAAANAAPANLHKVLIADDNRDAADSLTILLQGDGHDVRQAYDGNAAFALAETFRPDTMLLDIGMPGLSGYEVAERIRAQPWGRDVTLIALTGWGQAQDKQRAMAAGFDHHATKPVDPERLQSMVASARKPKADTKIAASAATSAHSR